MTSVSSLSAGLAALTSLTDSARARNGSGATSPEIRPLVSPAPSLPSTFGAAPGVESSKVSWKQGSAPEKLIEDIPALRAAAQRVAEVEAFHDPGSAKSSAPPAWLQHFAAYVQASYAAPVAPNDTGENVEFRVIQVHGNAQYTSPGNTNDIAFVYGNGTVNTGGGNDFAYLAANGTAYLGAGNDYAYQAMNSRTYGGAGNDTFRLAGNGTAYGDEGDDTFYLNANGTAHGGTGNDWIELHGNGTGYGGPGDDYLRGIGGGQLYGGKGNDTIMAGGIYAYLNGGVGDDTLIMTGYGNVIYARGDGNDVIRSLHAGGDFNRRTLAFGAGISKEDVEITTTDQGVRITFGAKEGSILLEGYQKGRVTMTFANGDKFAIGTEADAKPAAKPVPQQTRGSNADIKA